MVIAIVVLIVVGVGGVGAVVVVQAVAIVVVELFVTVVVTVRPFGLHECFIPYTVSFELYGAPFRLVNCSTTVTPPGLLHELAAEALNLLAVNLDMRSLYRGAQILFVHGIRLQLMM